MCMIKMSIIFDNESSSLFAPSWGPFLHRQRPLPPVINILGSSPIHKKFGWRMRGQTKPRISHKISDLWSDLLGYNFSSSGERGGIHQLDAREDGRIEGWQVENQGRLIWQNCNPKLIGLMRRILRLKLNLICRFYLYMDGKYFFRLEPEDITKINAPPFLWRWIISVKLCKVFRFDSISKILETKYRI